RAHARVRAVPGCARVPRPPGRRALRRAAATAGDRAGPRCGSGRAAPRRALARARPAACRRGLRGAAGDSRARPRDLARRAAGAADGGAGRPLARAVPRAPPHHTGPRGGGRQRHARGGVLLMTLVGAVLGANWQTLADAFGLGGIYALMAVGIGLVFGVLRLVNFAYGQLVMAGAYALAFAYTHGWPVWVGILLCFGVVVALSVAMDWVVFRPLRAHSPATMLVATFAVAFLMQ